MAVGHEVGTWGIFRSKAAFAGTSRCHIAAIDVFRPGKLVSMVGHPIKAVFNGTNV